MQEENQYHHQHNGNEEEIHSDDEEATTFGVGSTPVAPQGFREMFRRKLNVIDYAAKLT